MNERPSKPLLATLNGIRQPTPPIWLMRQAGRHLPEYRALRSRTSDFLKFCLDPRLAAIATLQPVQRYGLDAAIVFSDILIVPYGLGVGLAFKEGKGPVLEALHDHSPIPALDEGAFQTRVAPIYETVSGSAQSLPEGVTLIGFAGSPWTVATYMIEGGKSEGFPKARAWARLQPERMAALFAVLEQATVLYLDHQIKNGAECYQLFDSWAGALEHDFELFSRWIIEPNARILAKLKSLHPTIPAIAFPRGAGAHYQSFVREVRPEGLALDTQTDPALARTLSRHAVLQGNLDPEHLLSGGERMRNATINILDHLAQNPFIFNLGHGILPQTDPRHVTDLIKTVREYHGPATV